MDQSSDDYFGEEHVRSRPDPDLRLSDADVRQGLRIAPPEAPVSGYMFGKVPAGRLYHAFHAFASSRAYYRLCLAPLCSQRQ
jgi:hypothetical protein